MNHTKTPWKLSKDGTAILNAENFSIAEASCAYGVLEDWDAKAVHWSRLPGITCIDIEQETSDANAEFIVRAVNAYSEIQKLILEHKLYEVDELEDPGQFISELLEII